MTAAGGWGDITKVRLSMALGDRGAAYKGSREAVNCTFFVFVFKSSPTDCPVKGVLV